MKFATHQIRWPPNMMPCYFVGRHCLCFMEKYATVLPNSPTIADFEPCCKIDAEMDRKAKLMNINLLQAIVTPSIRKL